MSLISRWAQETCADRLRSSFSWPVDRRGGEGMKRGGDEKGAG